MDTTHEHMVEQTWRAFLTEGVSGSEQSQRRLFKLLPGFPRCKICWAPFHGAGSLVARNLYGKRPSSLNPHLCNFCEQFAAEYSGGAEIELSLLFADVPPFVMCQGQPAAARSMNFEGLRRRGWTPERISGVKAMHKALYRDDLTLELAKARIANMTTSQPETAPDVAMMLAFLDGTSAQRGIVR